MEKAPPIGTRPPRAASVPVMILCGGLGTRLRKVEKRPKALIPIAGAPFLTYTLRLLRIQGFREIHLLAGYGADQVEGAFGGPGVSVSRELEPMGTGGALSLARPRARKVNLILNGDSYAEAVYLDLLEAHIRGPAPSDGVTLLACRVEDGSDYGRLILDEDGTVREFKEKGARGAAWINAGVYVAGRGFFASLPEGPSSLERDVLPRIAKRGLLRAVRGRFFFRDIGTPERLMLARQEFRWIRNRVRDEEGSGLAEAEEELAELLGGPGAPARAEGPGIPGGRRTR